MNPSDIELLSNDAIPETVRLAIAEQVLGASDREAARRIESERIKQEARKVSMNTPLAAALAALITLSATFVFDRFTAKEDTANAITLEQFRNELAQSEVRLKQELDLAASESLAELEAKAKEREFQYDILRSELTNDKKSNADRAAVLLFLVRAGVLSSLNEKELQEMAERQIERPDATIIPQLTPTQFPLSGIVGRDDSALISDFDPSHPVHKLARAVGRLRILRSNQAVSTCTAFLVARDQIATAGHCMDTNAAKMQFELYPLGTRTPLSAVQYDVFDVSPATAVSDGQDGSYVILRLERPADDIYPPLPIDPGADLSGMGLGIIYFRGDGVQRAVWGPANCRTVKWDEILIHHSCDTGPGTSGSPVIDVETGTVIGVHAMRSETGGIAYRMVR